MKQEEQDKRFIDPSTTRKNNIARDKLRFHEGIPIFSIIEFNIYGTCTRRCEFCPISLDSFKKTSNSLDVALYEKILNDLSEINYDGKILFSGFSEPLLHKRLADLLRITKKKLPSSIMEIVSNSDLFDRVDVKSLFSAGLDTMSVSVYDGPEQLKSLQDWKMAKGFSDKEVILRRRYLENGNYGMTISNRSGLVDSNKYRDQNENKINELPLKAKCFYPFYTVMVDYNGDFLLCPHDWKKQFKVANLAEQNIWNVWSGKHLMSARRKLGKADRRFAPCITCDVKGDVVGSENYDAWAKSNLTA